MRSGCSDDFVLRTLHGHAFFRLATGTISYHVHSEYMERYRDLEQEHATRKNRKYPSRIQIQMSSDINSNLQLIAFSIQFILQTATHRFSNHAKIALKVICADQNHCRQ